MTQYREIPYQDRHFGQQQFAPFSQLDFACLLDSSSYTEQQDATNARFDIFSAYPYQTIELTNKQLLIDGEEAEFTEPFSYINHSIKQYSSKLPKELLHIPFAGGALGYFSYDLGRKLEQLPAMAKDDICQPLLSLGLYNWAVIRDHHLEKSWLIEFHPRPAGGLAGPSFEALIAMLDSPLPIAVEFKLTSDWHANMDRASYRSKFNKVDDYIHAGDCYQINLAQRFHARYQGSEWSAYCKLTEHNNAPFSAYIKTPDSTVLSVSPERFIKCEQNTLTTEPIKGTRPRAADQQQDQAAQQALLHSEKDKAENLMIVDLLRNDLSRSAIAGSVTVSKLFEVKSYAAVHHLVSTVTAKLQPEKTAFDALLAAFPGGSITGAPKVRAMQIIEELEPHRRNIYCGSIGYIDYRGNMDTSICIRTLVAKNHQLYCWAGGGLVADSTVDAEYQECFDKVNKILPVLK